MSRWFRHYAGMMRDEKLVRVSIACKQPIERVVWVWGAILESAAEVNDGGRYDVDAAEIAYFLRADEADVARVFDALAVSGRLAGNRVVKWGERQFSSDKSAPRQAAYRERKRAEAAGSDDPARTGDGGVTSPSRHRDAPEAEAETETEAKAEKQQPRDPLARVMELLEANGADTRWAAAPSHLRKWEKAGYDFERHIWPVLSERVAVMKAQGKVLPRTLSYFDGAIADRFADKPMPKAGAAAASAPDPRIPESDAKALQRLRAHERGEWHDTAWGPPPGAAGCLIPPHVLANWKPKEAA